jgi:hypothetical protein
VTTWFQVDHQALLDLAGRLSKIQSGLDDSKDYVFSFDGDLGSGDLKDELHSFINDWSQGRKQIDDDIKQAVGYLKGAGTAYKTVDEHLAARFKGMGGS